MDIATQPLLSVRGLRVEFDYESGPAAAVDGVSFDLRPGEVLGIVGESGSGKSVTALAIMGLLPQPPGRVAAGQILFEGANLLTKSAAEMRQIRGGRIGMIFQEPMTSLNPVFTVGDQIIETVLHHERISRRAGRDRALEMLDKVGIPSPVQRLEEYPHQLSGGMRQRIMIAIALSCSPSLLLADEPTTALDVTIQAQILDLLRSLQDEFKMAVVLISHDLGVVAEFVDRVAVMYAGQLVETADVATAFDRPEHPYTQGLLASIPSLVTETERLTAIPGTVPSPFDQPAGCRFAPRCAHVQPPCTTIVPPLLPCGPGHGVACIRHVNYRTEGLAT
ncbi:MAG: ABC transporter ATP-binding protein [Alphaproteobacteria bacterium]|nr:ABC transporter ATP-binding protein [Alphaproteobacteria bacterium]